MPNPLLDYIRTNKTDAVTWKAMHLVSAAGDDMHERDHAFDEIADMLGCIKSEMLLDSYTRVIATMFKTKPNLLLKKVKDDRDKIQHEKAKTQYLGSNQRSLQPWIDIDKYYRMGFDSLVDYENPDETGIYMPVGGEAVRVTNFAMTPLFHVYSKQDNNRRFTEINNGRTKAIVQFNSGIYNSVDSFSNAVEFEGVYFTMPEFEKKHLGRLKVSFLPMYPRCYELQTLGWQPEGFFAFSNLILKDGIIHFDEYGTADVDDMKYLSMSASNALKDVREDDDLYENDKFLAYMQADINFSQWSRMMVDVYESNGMMGVSWIFLSAFKDVVFKRDKSCPVPYGWGAVQSGKSKFGESIAHLFTPGMPAFNLNSGTEFAFRIRLKRFRNVPVVFNEFDENAIKDEWFRAFKGAFDGEGREKGTGKEGKTKTEKVNCLPMLLGQFFTTRDDGSLLTRAIPLKFIQNLNRTDKQKADYKKLKDLEQKGISSILTEVFAQRKEIERRYNDTFIVIARRLNDEFKSEGFSPKDRIVDNYAAVLALTLIMSEHIELAFTYEQFFALCKAEIVKQNNAVIESNVLGEFWKMAEYLLSQDMLEQGWDYKIETHTEITVALDRKENRVKTFTKPTKLLFVRMNVIHGLYSKEIRNRTGKPGQNEQTIITFLKDQDYYIGNSPSGGFRSKQQRKSMNTSSFVLNYDMMGVNLEQFDDQDEARVEITLEGFVYENARAVDVLGTAKVQFTLIQYGNYQKNGLTVEKKTYTKCFWHDLDQARYLLTGAELKVRGMLSVTHKGEQQFRSMEVQELTVMKSVMAPEENNAQDLF